MNLSYIIHDTNPNDRTQNENKGKVTWQLTQITKLFPENKAVAQLMRCHVFYSLHQGCQTRGPPVHSVRSFHWSYPNYRMQPSSGSENTYLNLKGFPQGP